MGNTILHARLALSIRDRELAEKHARKLDKLGFTIVKVAPRGVGFEGTVDLFERTFKCRIKMSANGAQFGNTPTVPETIEEHVDSVYFPTKPIYLG